MQIVMQYQMQMGVDHVHVHHTWVDGSRSEIIATKQWVKDVFDDVTSSYSFRESALDGIICTRYRLIISSSRPIDAVLLKLSVASQ